MKKIYEEPEIQIRNYVLPASNIVMTSDNNPDLTDGDNYGGKGDGSGDYFG